MQQRQPPVKVQFPHVRLPLTETIQLFSCRHTSFFLRCTFPPSPRPEKERKNDELLLSERIIPFRLHIKKFSNFSSQLFPRRFALLLPGGRWRWRKMCDRPKVACCWHSTTTTKKKDSRTISSAVSSLKFNCINFNRENLLTDHAQEQSWGCVCVGVSMCEQQTEKNLKYL